MPRDQMQERVDREFLSAPACLFVEAGAKAVSNGRNTSTVPGVAAVSLVAQHIRLQV